MKMGKEIERKFLVDPEKMPRWYNPTYITQYYLSEDNPVVRIRTISKTLVSSNPAEHHARLTIKGETVGITRAEYEYEIPFIDAVRMMNDFHVSNEQILNKKRYLVHHGDHTWEVDVFEDMNDGLIIAEIELESEDEIFKLPDWVTKEVSDDPKYFNNNLIKNPFNTW